MYDEELMTEAEIANLYRQLVLCKLKGLKSTTRIVRTMKSLAVVYGLLYDVQHTEKYVYHTLWYNDERVYELRV